MRLPGFTAELSLYQAGERYRGVGQPDADREAVVRPQRINQGAPRPRGRDPEGSGGRLQPIVCYYDPDTLTLIDCSV